MKLKARIVLAASLLSVGGGAVTASAQSEAAAPVGAYAAPVDGQGNLHVPDDYRTAYQALGAWAIAASGAAGSKEMHSVYASPGAIAAYQKTGAFPDGTTLVKEVFQAATGPMTTGTVSHPAKLVGWFVMVRDTKNDHSDNPLWGDGWGWSWFDAGKPLKTTSTNYKVDCQGCHIPAKATDWIYVGGYPVLSK